MTFGFHTPQKVEVAIQILNFINTFIVHIKYQLNEFRRNGGGESFYADTLNSIVCTKMQSDIK